MGIFNGIIGTTKAVLGDISDDSNQAVGCAFLSAGWVGPMLVASPDVFCCLLNTDVNLSLPPLQKVFPLKRGCEVSKVVSFTN